MPREQKNNPKEYLFEQEGCYITELSNKQSDPDSSIAKAQVEVAVTTAWHSLIDVTERYCILSGKGRVEIGDELPREVGPDDVVIIPPMVRQRISNIGRVDLVFLAICTPRFTPECYRSV